MTKTRIQLSDAARLAADLQAEMSPACERIEIAGSLRREERSCGDIEFVIIPKRDPDLYGRPTESKLDPLLQRLVDRRILERGRKNGDRQKQLIITAGNELQCPGLVLELFICEPATWGVMFAIRTGSADYSHAIVTQRCEGGLLADGHRVRHGRVWRKGDGEAIADGQAIPTDELLIDGDTWYRVLPTPEEKDVLALAGGYIQPQLRTREMVANVRGSRGFAEATGGKR